MRQVLSKNQLAAIHSDERKICVLACAGSGKTTTLTHRIARLLNTNQADPKNVAAITFTVLAADKLRSELAHLVKRKQAISEMYIGTIHAFSFELIKLADPLNADDFTVLDQSRQFILLNKVWNDWNIKELAPDLKRGSLLEKLQTTINIIKLEGIELDLLKSRHPRLAEILASYKTILRENFYFDFADLLSLAVGIFERSPPFRELVRERFKWLFVDEYQDVDPTQERLIHHLSQTAHLCVVGDDDQAIYQFRGTDVRNILTLANSLPGSALFRLETNLRCRSNIVAVSKDIIERTESRLPKSIEAKELGGCVEAHQFATLQDEINFIIDRIQTLRPELRSYGDITILMRSLASYGQSYLEALSKAGIPHVSKGDRSLFNEPAVRRVRGILEVIAKEVLQVEHLSELSPLIELDLQRLTEDTRDVSVLEIEDWELLGINETGLELVNRVLEVREAYWQGAFNSTLEVVLAVIDKFELLVNTSDPSVFYNLCKLTEIVRDFDEIEETSRVHRLCAYFSIYANGSFDEATPLDAETDAVQVLTIHQAKGLEFRVVFMPMLVERRFPLERTSDRWLLDNDLFEAVRYSSNLDDERRLFYVGATRPQDYLFLTCARNIGLKNPVKPSIFYEEAATKVKASSQLQVMTTRPNHKGKVDVPLVTSYSSLEYYLTCPYRYLLLQEYGLATPPNLFFSLGRTVHLVARLIHEERKKGIILEDHEIEKLFLDHLRPVASQLPAYVLKRRIAALLSALKRYLKGKENWISNTVNVEVPFDYLIPGAVIRGRIDLLIKSNHDSVEIIDWKTGQPHEYLHTNFQMQIYTLAALEQLDLKVSKATLHYIERDESVEYLVNDQFISNGKATLTEVIQGIKDKQFGPKPGTVCTRCECRPVCKYRFVAEGSDE